MFTMEQLYSSTIVLEYDILHIFHCLCELCFSISVSYLGEGGKNCTMSNFLSDGRRLQSLKVQSGEQAKRRQYNGINTRIIRNTNKPHVMSPRANYTDRATAACWRSDCQLLRIKDATWSA
jgi:hypothetical protein